MNKYLTKAIAIIAACFLSYNANAQTDTSYYDLGRIRIKKGFTQSVTVKAEELEKFPSTNLTDALTVWLSGQFTRTVGVVYVIDGDLINNVDAFSVFDIESATLIQNATTAVNGITQQKDLVLIQTRMHTGKSGFMAAGQTNLIGTRTTPNVTGQTSYYHQYYLSAYQNTDHTHFGISANYQHDAASISTSTASAIVYNIPTMDRYKFYSYFDTKVGGISSLNISVNYVPQNTHINNLQYIYGTSSAATQTRDQDLQPTLLNAKLALTSSFASKLNNKLTFNYGNVSSDYDYTVSNVQTANNYYTHTVTKGSANNFLIRDNLQYQISKGDWDIEPSLNFMFRYAKSSSSSDYSATGSVTSIGGAVNYTENKMYLLTPSLNIGYKDIFNVQGGAVVGLKPYAYNKRVSSFVTSSVDVTRLAKAKGSYSWKVFASYANYGNFYDTNNSLIDQSAYLSDPLLFYTVGGAYLGNGDHSFNNLQAGSTLSLFNKKLTLDYNFERRQYLGYALNLVSIGTGYTTLVSYPPASSQLNRFGITASIFNNAKVKWMSGINGSHITNKYDDLFYPYITGTVVLDNKQWTGGWVNRVEAGQFSFGADMLYLINEANTLSNNPSSFVLQNAYVSYNIKTKAFKSLDIYANTRNLAQNTRADITDNRKFYGVGFKAGF